MSTKIYQGFRIETRDLMDIKVTVEAFRPYVARKSQEMLDRFLANLKKPEDGWEFWRERRRKSQQGGEYDPATDTDFDLIFLPLPDQDACLGVAIGPEAWYRAWVRRPQIQNYSYWNNSDKPDHITRKEWDKRSADWNKVDGVALRSEGFVISLGNPWGPTPRQSYWKAKSN